mmetsp:Transcript_5168/g.7914  ORF Transcript_5168/g.7914 Transcript_5168/m.7914 type:complete len:145 (+) Transcript_5168:86-520(+)
MRSTATQVDRECMEVKSWRTQDHSIHRMDIQRCIEDILVSRSSSRKKETCKNRFPVMAKRLEQLLYLQASSFEEYIKLETLSSRLVLLAASYSTPPRRASESTSPNNVENSFEVETGSLLSKRHGMYADDSEAKRCYIDERSTD